MGQSRETGGRLADARGVTTDGHEESYGMKMFTMRVSGWHGVVNLLKLIG